MSDRGQQDYFIMFMLGLALVIAVIVSAVYFLSMIWPYLVFYVLPFVLVSLLVGGILWVSGLVQDGGKFQEEGNLKKYFAKFNYKWLAITFPALMALNFAVFELDSKVKQEVNKNGEVQKIYLEWPKVHKAFNDLRKRTYSNSRFEALREKSRVEELYDRSQVGGIFWLALIFGGPGLFFFLARHSEDIEASIMSEEINRVLKSQKDHLRQLTDKQEEIIKSRQQPLLSKINELEEDVEYLRAENQVLQAKVEFSTTAPKIAAAEKKALGGGVLDSDLL